MDVRLRTLKRLAEDDPSYWPVYARALEQTLGGIGPFHRQETDNYTLFGESYIADVEHQPHLYDPLAVSALELTTTGSIQTIGYLVDVHWASAFGEDEWPEIWENLTPEFQALLTDAERLGYEHILLWIF